MGIDIRNGPQLECINCGLCIDACDEIMLKVGRPEGLIAYDTDAAVAAREGGQAALFKLIRPRTIYYAAALAAVSVLMAWGLVSRPAMELHVVRDRNPMFVVLHDGSIRNGYTLKIDNRTLRPQAVQVSFTGVPGAVLKTPGAPSSRGQLTTVVDPDGESALRVLVSAPPGAAGQSMTRAAFRIEANGSSETQRTVFVTGAGQ
jgi:polyferredoxin